MSKNAPAFPSTGWKETMEPGEEELFKDFARKIEIRQKEVADQTGKAVLRGFHAKLHAGLVAEFKVRDDLPLHACFGVFSKPRVFPAVVRFSNGKPTSERDAGREPRGIAIKLIGVEGPKLLTPPGERDAVTQDFLATSHSVTSTVRNAGQFIHFIEAMGERFMPGALARRVGWREATRILAALGWTMGVNRVRSMATEHFSGTAPIQCGPYAVKFTVCPAEGTPLPVDRPRTDNFLREELVDRLSKGDIVMDFIAQFFVDEKHTPIEDTSIPWKPADSPCVPLAQLRIPSCDLRTPEGNASDSAVDRLSFSPWHGLKEHKPLGSIMRARKFAYQASSALRGHREEPTTLPL